MWVKVGQVQACCGLSRLSDTSLEILCREFPYYVNNCQLLKDSALCS